MNFQGHVVTTDLPTLGTSRNTPQSGITTQEAKDLGKSAWPGQTLDQPLLTVCQNLADCPSL
jgi:hypothetical protein